MLKILLIDDEPRARRILRNLLEENFMQIEIVGEAGDVPEAVKAIQQLKPNLVFLDVEMPRYSGFELFDFIQNDLNFEVIFATAYNEYAIRAFEVSAVGYLLKPIQLDALKNSIKRAIQRIQFKQKNKEISTLIENVKSPKFKKIALSTTNGISFENIEDIIYLKAEGSYTEFNIRNRGLIVISKKIKHFENTLSPDLGFFRIHRSYIVNTNFIKELSRGNTSSITLENGEQLPVSRELKGELINYLGLKD